MRGADGMLGKRSPIGKVTDSELISEDGRLLNRVWHSFTPEWPDNSSKESAPTSPVPNDRAPLLY